MGDKTEIILISIIISFMLIIFANFVYSEISNLTIVFPANNAVLTYNENITLNYNVSSDTTLDSCWYNINGGENIPLTCGQNTSFNVSDENQNYTVYVFAKDSEGNIGEASVNFSLNIDDDNDTILNFEDMCPNTPVSITNEAFFPIATSFTNITDFTNLDLMNLTLFVGNPNFGNIMFLNNLSIVRINSIGCLEKLDFDSNINISYNRIELNSSAMPELNKPARLVLYNLTFTHPVILKDGGGCSYSDCPINFYSEDKNLSFNVTGFSVYSAKEADSCENGAIDDTGCLCGDIVYYSGDCCDGVHEACASDDDDSPSSDTSDDNTETEETEKIYFGLLLTQIPDLIVEPGESKEIILYAENTGTSYLSSCKIVGIGNYSSWISTNDTKSISVDDSDEFLFNLNVPQTATPGSNLLELSLECSEFSKSFSFTAEVITQAFDLKLIKTEKKTNEIIIDYYLEELLGKEQEVELHFSVLDLNNQTVGELTESKNLSANSTQEFESFVPLNSSLKENFNLLINLTSMGYSTSVKKEISQDGFFASLTSLAVFESLGNLFSNFKKIVVLIISGIVLLFGISAIFLIRKFLKVKKERKLVLGY